MSKGWREPTTFPSQCLALALPNPITKQLVHTDVPYKTRMVVRRPLDPKRFNGSVVIEWLNVTDGFDGEYFWVQAKDHLLRSGYAYVGLSAQDKAVSGGPLSLKQFSPVRYSSEFDRERCCCR